jgi:integrase
MNLSFARQTEVISHLAGFHFLSQPQLDEFLFAGSSLTALSRQVIVRRILARLRTQGLVQATPRVVLFTDRRGRALTGNAVRKLFERLEARTGIRGLCAHMLRHTWATNFHRSRSGTRFDLMVEGGWTTGRMVERYTKARPFEERRKAPSPFTASRDARKEKRPSEKRPPQKRSALDEKRIA